MRASVRSNAQPVLNKGLTMSKHRIRIDRLAGARISFSYISSGHLKKTEPEGCRTRSNPLISNHP